MPEIRRPRAVLVGVLVQGRDEADLDSSLDELSRLADTLGMVEVGRVTQRRTGTGAAAVLGEGKLQELAMWTGGFEDHPEDRRADAVIVDHELTPSQLRNIQEATGVEVLDRNGVIIEIFSARANTREARLQVELARLAYMAPRLRELGGPSERQRGKGAGETSVELDKRKIRDRMAALRRELQAIEQSRGTTRERRDTLRQVALVGYTNAGKSSLMRTLTGAEPYVADQLFATLDTTVRRLHPDITPSILVTDTVGFIKDLPHSLVASFRSTLDAALDAQLLLQVVDASDPSWPDQERVTAEVLAEIDAADLPRVLVFNKCDRLAPGEEAALRVQRPDAWFTSAHDADRVAQLHAQIVERFHQADAQFDYFVPWSASEQMGVVRAQTFVVSEAFEDDGVRYVLRAPAAVRDRILGVAPQPPPPDEPMVLKA